MIQAATEWIRAVLLVSFLATLVKLLLPDNTLRPFVRLVMGFVVLSVLIQPLLAVVQDPDPWDGLFGDLSVGASAFQTQSWIHVGQQVTERGTAVAVEQVTINVSRQIEAIVSLLIEVEEVQVNELRLTDSGVERLTLDLRGAMETGDGRVKEVLFKYFGIPETAVRTHWNRQEGESPWTRGNIG